MQIEHLPVIASLLGIDSIDPATLRRNICVSGLNLLALKEKQFQIGDAVLEYTGQCHPCSFMEETFGEGGYNAMRGHGGITARIIKSGLIKLNDSVSTLK
jgi:MOSC domain-containing protein YiiM